MLIEMTPDDVSLIAGAYPQPSDWRRVMYDGTHLNVPDDMVGAVNAVDLPAERKKALISYAAARRYSVETAGLTVGGVNVATDRQSQSMLSAAYNMAQANAAFSTMWKGASGNFTSLSSAQIIAVAQAVGAFVGSCFSAEAAVVANINSGSVTTKSQIDAAIVVPA